MDKAKIAKSLRNSREKAELSVQQVSELLGAMGHKSAPKTIYGWENGHSEPSADTLLALCEIYGISDILLEFGYKKAAPDYEDADMQEALMKCFKKLNCEGRRILLENAHTMVASNKYNEFQDSNNGNGNTSLAT